MNTVSEQSSTKYVVCHNGSDVYHYCIVDVGQELCSGQPYMDVFNTEAEAFSVYGDKITYLQTKQG